MNRLVALWLMSLAVVGLLASIATAQVTRTTPRVVSGGDIGFRIEGRDVKGQPVGRLVVKIDGDWVPVSDSIQPAPALTSR
jgi:hypothetical protein